MSIEVGAQLAALHRNGRVVGGGVGGPIHGEVGDIAPGVVGGTPHHDHLAGTRVHPLQVLYGTGNCGRGEFNVSKCFNDVQLN